MEAVILTITFNIICIGYTTLVGANFVCGLYEEWMKMTSPQVERDTQEISRNTYTVVETPSHKHGHTIELTRVDDE